MDSYVRGELGLGQGPGVKQWMGLCNLLVNWTDQTGGGLIGN